GEFAGGGGGKRGAAGGVEQLDDRVRPRDISRKHRLDLNGQRFDRGDVNGPWISQGRIDGEGWGRRGVLRLTKVDGLGLQRSVEGLCAGSPRRRACLSRRQ